MDRRQDYVVRLHGFSEDRSLGWGMQLHPRARMELLSQIQCARHSACRNFGRIVVMGPSTWWKEMITANGKWGSCRAMQVTEARWCESKVSLVGYLEGGRIRGCHRDWPKRVSETGVELPTRRLKQIKTRQARPKVMTDNSWTFRVLLPCTCRFSRGSTRNPRRRCPHSPATP